MSLQRKTCAVPAIALGVMLAAASVASAAAPRGERLSENWCSQCHAVKPNQSSTNPAAPTFSDVAAERSVTEYSLRVFLRTTHATMPNFKMEAGDIADIARYIVSLKPR